MFRLLSALSPRGSASPTSVGRAKSGRENKGSSGRCRITAAVMAMPSVLERLEDRRLLAAAVSTLPNGTSFASVYSALALNSSDHPLYMAVADFNHDGYPDVVTSSGTSSNIDLWLNNGKSGPGSFAAPIVMGSGATGDAVVVAAADLNGDGAPDIIVGSTTEGLPATETVTVFLNNGNGTFKAPARYPMRQGTGGIDSIAVGDLNGDGHPDIVVNDREGRDVYVLFNNGSGGFTVTGVPVGYGSTNVVLAHMRTRQGTTDTNLDIVVDNAYDQTVSVLYPNAAGTDTFQPQYVTFTGANLPTIVLPNNPRMSFSKVGSNPTMQVLTDPVSHFPDIVIGDGHEFTIMFGNSDGSFQPPVVSQALKYQASSAVFTTGLAVGDGYDIVSTDGAYTETAGTSTILVTPVQFGENVGLTQGSITLGEPQIFAVGPTIQQTPYSPSAVAIADVNGDGHPDVLTADYYAINAVPGKHVSVSTMLGNGNNLFQAQQVFPSANNATGSAVAIADFNGDGNPDVVVTQAGATTVGTNGTITYGPGSVTVFLGNGDGSFDPYGRSYNVGIGPSDVAVGDFNGHEDIVVTNAGSYQSPGNSISVLLGNGDGTFQAPRTYTVGVKPSYIAIGDLLKNGKQDIVIANAGVYPSYGKTLTILYGDGAGGFAKATLNVGNEPRSVGIADLNGDGKPDIAVANYIDHDVVVYFGDGNGNFTQDPLQASIPLNSPPNQLQIGDIVDGNADGVQDMVVGSTYGNTINIFRANVDSFGNAVGTFYVQQVYDTSPDGNDVSMILTDMNGDNLPDIVLAEGSAFTLLANLGGGTGIFEDPTFLTNPGLINTSFTPQDAYDGEGFFAVGSLLRANDPRNDGLPSVVMPSFNGMNAAFTDILSLPVPSAPRINGASGDVLTAGAPQTLTFTYTGSPSPTITETGSIPGMTFTNEDNGTLTFAGTPSATSGGDYTITINATNTLGSVSLPFAITVDQAPAFTSANHAGISVGSAAAFSVFTSGFPAATIAESGPLPAGITFHGNANGTANISGTAIAGSSGVYTIMLTASNGIGTGATQTFALTVTSAPIFSGPTTASFAVGTAGNVTISTSASPVAALTESPALPANLGITFTDNGDGTATIGGTANAGFGGQYVITLTASNGPTPAMETFTIVVSQSPAITSASTAAFQTGTNGSFTITTSATPTASLSLSGSLPPGLSFQDNHDGTGTISGNVLPGLGGNYTVNVTAGNGSLPNATQSLTLQVSEPASIMNEGGMIIGIGTSSSDTASLSVSNGNLVVQINSVSASFPLGIVNSIVLSTLGGDDSITIAAGVPAVSVNGNGGNDTIVATNAAADTLNGGAGNDSVTGGAGNESLAGGAGNDTLISGAGNDTLDGGSNADSVVGGAGMDLLIGGNGPDTIIAHGMNNTLRGGKGHDSLVSAGGQNYIDGGPGSDTILGSSSDTIVPDPMDVVLGGS